MCVKFWKAPGFIRVSDDCKEPYCHFSREMCWDAPRWALQRQGLFGFVPLGSLLCLNCETTQCKHTAEMARPKCNLLILLLWAEVSLTCSGVDVPWALFWISRSAPFSSLTAVICSTRLRSCCHLICLPSTFSYFLLFFLIILPFSLENFLLSF